MSRASTVATIFLRHMMPKATGRPLVCRLVFLCKQAGLFWMFRMVSSAGWLSHSIKNVGNKKEMCTGDLSEGLNKVYCSNSGFSGNTVPTELGKNTVPKELGANTVPKELARNTDPKELQMNGVSRNLIRNRVLKVWKNIQIDPAALDHTI